MSKLHFPKTLWAAVRQYYKWQDGKKVKLIKFVEDPDGVRMLLVQIVDDKNDKLSTLMTCYETDNHWDVSEMFFCYRKDEAQMIENFEDGDYRDEYESIFDIDVEDEEELL